MANRINVTNAELGRKLDEAARIMVGHMERDEGQFKAVLEIFHGDDNGKLGIKTRLDRLEQTAKTYTWSLRALWTATIAALTGTIVGLLTGRN